MILVDTSAWVDHFNGHGSVEATALAELIGDAEPIVLSGLCVTELLMGLRSEADAEKVAGLLEAFERAPALEERDFREAARIFRVCRRAGATVRSPIDCLLAQTCLRYGYSILSKDRDISEIAKHFPLRLTAARER